MSLLEGNLDALVRDPRLRAAILDCVPARARWDETGPAPVLRVDGIALHSAEDPDGEAERFADQVALAGADHVLLFGIGAGHALAALRRRGSFSIIVLEPDLDVARACLSARPIVVDGCLLLSDGIGARAHLRHVTRRGERVLLLGWPPTVRRHREAFARLAGLVREATLTSQVARNTWDLRLTGWVENLLVNLPRALAWPDLGALTGALRGTPAFLCAAGPSLEKNVAALRRLDGRGLVLTVNTAVPALDRHQVPFDLVACVESLDVSSHMIGSPGLARSRMALSLTSNPAHFSLRPRGLLPFTDRVGYYAGWLEEIRAATTLETGCCAAHAAFSTARLLGCDPIVLVGQDAALTGGEFYAPSTRFGGMRLGAVEDGRGTITGDEAKVRLHGDGPLAYRAGGAVTLREAAAWGGSGTVATTLPLDFVREWYEEVAAEGEVRLINATEGGARIAGVPEAHLADVITGLGGPRIDVAAILDAAPPRPDEARAHAIEGIARAREQALAGRRAAERLLASPDPSGSLLARLRADTRMPLLQGFVRRDVLGVVERRGDLRAMAAVLARGATALAIRLGDCKAAMESRRAEPLVSRAA